MNDIADKTGHVVYLLHFDTPYRHARHYLGSTDNLQRRLMEHEHGTGARLMAVVVREHGIGYVVARLWAGGKRLERELKNKKNAPRLCPVCRDAGK